ncbi:family 20 glycosylhydrolase [Flavobacterium sp. LC2016-01]|uniref:beta-N-acetylhexosaminidase n=1 Tax=Flavobacterium sp. LC2016-01 TaxID=2675876 RepID=UPI0012BAC0B3|nr:family 20 glycosylhydrolase [Flavobacterium sp. LC2016-01]MTH16383.1 family 20 glycosylhydrolase [Flavobacterium sp. LC2016-01]
MKKSILLIAIFLSSLSTIQAQQLDIIPKPVKVEQKEGTFIIPSSVQIIVDKKAEKSVDYIKASFSKYTGINPVVSIGKKYKKNTIAFLVDEKMNLPNDGYKLTINKKGILIKGKSSNGVLNGLQTLLQICSAKDVKKGSIPFVKIEDYPRFEWRGMMLDCSRQFFDKQTVLNYIDWLAAHKMNIFHWHLTDDNGWRAEIKSMPDLTLKGAWRGPGEVLLPSYGSGDKRYGGFYTQADMKEVVAYASARGISVMPEIEIPGHSRAVTASYPEIGCAISQELKSVLGEVKNVWCVGREENYQILDSIIREFSEMFPFEYIHVAGDEVNRANWEHCPKCQALMAKEGFTDSFQLQNYFFKRVQAIVDKYHKKTDGWNEILKGGEINPNTLISAWQGISYGIESAKKGYETIMMPGQYLYFDMAQSETERGHRWAAITDTKRAYSFEPIPNDDLTPEQQKLIKGVQGALWSEYLDRPTRFVEYQSYPRISALSEIGWSKKEDKNWEDFYGRLTHSHLQRLANMGIAFRDFPPTAIYQNGTITVTPPYEGAVVRYDAQGNEPTRQSALYTKPIQTKDYEHYMFRTFFNEDVASPAVKVEKLPVANWNTSKVEVLNISENISDHVDKNGIWYLTFNPTTDGSANGVVRTVSLFENDKLIQSFPEEKTLRSKPRLRFVIENYNEKNTYRLDFTVENKEAKESSAKVNFNCSPYLEPEVKVTSSMAENPKFPIATLEDYNIESYLRTDVPCANGDWILYTFTNPVTSSKIDVLTGIPHHPRFIVNNGYVEYSYNGIDFIKGDAFDYGNASVYPKQPVKAVKIVITGTNNEPLMASQDLRINP